MKSIINNLISGKSVLILGFGREGKATLEVLKSINSASKIGISDKLDVRKDNEIDRSIDVYFGDNYLDYIKKYDVVFKSPGVVLFDDVDKGNAIITSEIEVFLQKYSKQIIGVTGTKGKSTVSSLIYHVLKTNGTKCIFAGNIGIPVFNIEKDIDNDTTIVLELSSHQLEHCKYSPKTAAFLNIYEEHLDHYKDFNAYYDAKKNIYMHQDSDGILYCSEQVDPRKVDSNIIKSSIQVIDKTILPFKSFDEFKSCKLIGEHNLFNVAIAYKICKDFGVDENVFLNALSTFEPLPHRLQFIGEKDLVKYYDDSISTTAESCISAIKSIENLETVIVGGMDRGINYSILIDFFKKSKLKNVILMYKSGKRIFDELSKEKALSFNYSYCSDLKEATNLAKKLTNKNAACVLSPAAASYGDFINFEERGDKFKEFVFQ